MTNKTKNLLSFLAIGAFFILAMASSAEKKMTFTKQDGQIPPDFGTTNDTLLVVKHPENSGYDHYLTKNFQENYFGHYIIIKPQELINYSPDKYRYVFDYNLNYTSVTTQTTTDQAGGYIHGGVTDVSYTSSSHVGSSSFHILDRATQKAYSTKASSFYSKLMKNYLIALNNERKSN